MEISYNAEGFFSDTKYYTNLNSFLELHKDKFYGAEKLHVQLHEVASHQMQLSKPTAINISKDAKKIIIVFSESKIYGNNGMVLGLPEVDEVYGRLELLLTKAAKGFNDMLGLLDKNGLGENIIVDKINYLKENIKHFCDGVFSLVGEDFIWDYLEGKFKINIEKRIDKIRLQNADTLLVEANLYDVITETKKGNKSAMRLLHFLNSITKDLTNLLSDNEKALVRKNVQDLLLSFDTKYLNFAGELAVLHGIISSGKYNLIKVEMGISNGKTIDFCFEEKDSKELLLVEVLNIRLDDDKVEADEEKIRTFISQRLVSKIDAKKAGLKSIVNFDLVPVLWGNSQSLKVYSNHFKFHEININNVHEPMAYCTFIEPGNEHQFINRFARISKLL